MEINVTKLRLACGALLWIGIFSAGWFVHGWWYA